MLAHQAGPGITLLGGITLAANPTAEAVASLEADWPKWQIWTVPLAVGGTVWCARRWDSSGKVLNAHSSDELAEYLEAEVSR